MKQNRATIIDIGSGKIVALVGVATPDGAFVVDANSVVLCDVFYKGGLIKDDIEDSVKKALQEVEKLSGLKIKEVYIGVPPEFSVVVTNQTSTAWKRGSLIQKSDVEYLADRADSFAEARGSHTQIDSAPISFIVDDKVYYRGIEGMYANSLTAEFSYVFADNFFIDYFTALLKKLNVNVKGFVSTAMAQANYLLDEASRENAILVDCGFTTTSVSFVCGDGLLHLDSFPIGGAHITHELMEAFEIAEYDAAEALKGALNLNLECAENDSYILRGHSYKARRSNEIVSDLIKQIARNMEACGRQCPYAVSKNVNFYMTGGGLNYIKGGLKLLGDMFGKEFQTIKSRDIKLRYPEYSSAYSVLNKALRLNAKVLRGLF